jgi:hypothetical protein
LNCSLLSMWSQKASSCLKSSPAALKIPFLFLVSRIVSI